MSIISTTVTTTAGAVYTSAGSTAITFMSLCNYSGGNVLANVYAVPAGNTASTTNQILASIELASLDTYQMYAGGEKLLLDNGDTLQVNASANAAVTVVTSYTSI